jgi:hypothetical protein
VQMEVGRIAGGTLAWSRAHFGAWCVVSAPLILGLDVTDQKTLETIVPFIANDEGAALILYSYCTHTVLVLYSYCTHTVLVLYSQCTHTALVLYSYTPPLQPSL